MLHLAYWTHDLSPFLIQFGDNLGIRYYGLAYMLGLSVPAGCSIVMLWPDAPKWPTGKSSIS